MPRAKTTNLMTKAKLKQSQGIPSNAETVVYFADMIYDPKRKRHRTYYYYRFMAANISGATYWEVAYNPEANIIYEPHSQEWDEAVERLK